MLNQDTTTGGLSYEPALAVSHDPPDETFQITLGAGTVVATGIHRFWRAGKGWTMARDLKPGNLVRTVGGSVAVNAVADDSVQPVFNSEIAHGQGFFYASRNVCARPAEAAGPHLLVLSRPNRAGTFWEAYEWVWEISWSTTITWSSRPPIPSIPGRRWRRGSRALIERGLVAQDWARLLPRLYRVCFKKLFVEIQRPPLRTGNFTARCAFNNFNYFEMEILSLDPKVENLPSEIPQECPDHPQCAAHGRLRHARAGTDVGRCNSGII